VVLRVYLLNEKRMRLQGVHSKNSKNLRLLPLEDSLLATWKCRRDSRYAELAQYVTAEDDASSANSGE
jgi:hypothetical protein